MVRDAHVPVFLWACAAALLHLAGGRSAVEVATFVVDQQELREMVAEVRRELRGGDVDQELLIETELSVVPVDPERGELRGEEGEGDAEPDDDLEDPEAERVAALDPVAEEKKKKDEERPPEEKKAPEPETPPEEEKAIAAKALPPPDGRIAIKQHTEKNQPDNPNAQRIADHAHHTEDETIARHRSFDQDEAQTNPGTRAGNMEEPGNADDSKVAHAEERDGAADRAPGESSAEASDSSHSEPPQPVAAATPAGGGGQPGRPTPPTPEAPTPATPGGAGPAAEETVAGDHGAYTLDPANPGGDGRSAVAGRRRTKKPFIPPSPVGNLGLGGTGLPGVGNLNQNALAQVVGEEQFRKEREADGASRKSRHRGSSNSLNWERYKAAIENYEPRVKLGNQTSLNAAQSPFASYLNAMHNRIHPVFAETHLASFDALPIGHAFNQTGLVTHLEIILDANNGSIVDMGVTKASGVTAFDATALASVEQASPFGKAPDAIRSPDGNVYLHWEFHRHPYHACSTRNARPFVLKQPPKIKPRSPFRPPGTRPSDEQPSGPLLPLRRP